MTIPRQLAPTVGQAHGGVKFLEGSVPGFKKIVIGPMTKNRRGRIHINYEFHQSKIEEGFRSSIYKIEIEKDLGLHLCIATSNSRSKAGRRCFWLCTVRTVEPMKTGKGSVSPR